jgi:hypothetical protein
MNEGARTGWAPSRRELLAVAGAGLAVRGLISPVAAAAAPAAAISAAAAPAAAAPAAAISAAATSAGPAPAGGGDVKLLSRLLSVEHALSGTYRQVLVAGRLGVVVAAELNRFWEQDRQHIAALERELSHRGAPIPPAPAPPAGSLAQSPAQALSRLQAAEMRAESAYLNAVAKFQAPSLVGLATQIMASEAQHLALLRLLQNPAQPAAAVPVAFVHGSG